MPQEKKKRGRRAEEGRRKQQEEEIANAPPEEIALDPYSEVAYDGSREAEESTFFGLLDESEQEYFKNVGERLRTEVFESEEEREIYLTNIYKEADDKILKLVSSQGCSRVVERLILLSSEKQLKNLFQKCSGNFLHLVQHRFASHFCESLFAQAATFVSKEQEEPVDEDVKMTDDEVFASMESLFLYTLNELEPSIHSLLTDPFASHSIRVLFMVLSGKGTQATASANLISGKGKENQLQPDQLAEDRIVPYSFKEATERILKDLAEKLSIRELRILATHQIGSPTLQLFLRIELADARKAGGKKDKKALKKNTLLGKLLSSDDGEEDSVAGSFLQNLFYDSVGSHLLETVIQCSSSATFEQLYNSYFKDRFAALARNDTASFVAQKIVDRLEGEQLQNAMDSVIPLVPNLLERSLLGVIKGLIENCTKREVDASKLVKAIKDTYQGESKSVVMELLKLTEAELQPPAAAAEGSAVATRAVNRKATPQQMHGSLLAQAIVRLPNDLGDFINESLLAQSTETLVLLAQHPSASHLVQASLTSPHATILHKRKLLNNLLGNFPQLAMNPCGSHVVDSCWTATAGMNKYRQLIAEELIKREPDMRASHSGTMVWRNWRLDKYKSRRGEWFQLDIEEGSKDSGHGGGGAPTTGANGRPMGGRPAGGAWGNGEKKSAIQLARERRAAERKKREELQHKRARKEEMQSSSSAATGSNGTGISSAAATDGTSQRKRAFADFSHISSAGRNGAAGGAGDGAAWKGKRQLPQEGAGRGGKVQRYM